MTPRRVLIVDDHPVVRRGLRALLEAEPWVEKVFESGTVTDAVRLAVTQSVHLVAMDLRLPDGDGIDATRRILTARPGVRVLVLTMVDDPDLTVRALRAGARGYLLKETDPDTLVDSLRNVANGAIFLGPGVDPVTVTMLQRGPALPPPFNRLTARERDILTGIARGHSTAEIARKLGVSDKTVRNQLTFIFAKIGVSDRVQAVILTREAGIVD